MKPIEHARALWLAVKITAGAIALTIALIGIFYAYTFYAQWKVYGL